MTNTRKSCTDSKKKKMGEYPMIINQDWYFKRVVFTGKYYYKKLLDALRNSWLSYVFAIDVILLNEYLICIDYGVLAEIINF